MTKPVEYHNNLIDALKLLKGEGANGASAWLAQTDASLVEEAYRKDCIEFQQGHPVLTERGEVVSRMRIVYQRGTDMEYVLPAVMMTGYVGAGLSILAVVTDAPRWLGGVFFLIFAAVLLIAHVALERDSKRVIRTVEFDPK